MWKYLSLQVRKYLRRRLRRRLEDERDFRHAASYIPFASTEIERKFPLDGRRRAVHVNIVEDYGHQWINVICAKPFGLASSAWKGRAGSQSRHRSKQGLQRQTEKMLRAAKQDRVIGYTPRVIVRFTRGVSRPVAEALREMGAEVEGEIVEPPAPRSERE